MLSTVIYDKDKNSTAFADDKFVCVRDKWQKNILWWCDNRRMDSDDPEEGQCCSLDDSGYADLFGPEPTVPLDDSELLQALGEYPDFLFHLARNRHGRVYYRVLRTLLLDKGKLFLAPTPIACYLLPT